MYMHVVYMYMYKCMGVEIKYTIDSVTNTLDYEFTLEHEIR